MRVAVADVGTNSTHLLIAEAQGGHYRVLDALKVRTRLGECLDERGHMTPQGEGRLREALLRFRELAGALEVPSVRVYATSALREAPNGPEIAERMRQETGVYPVIISGEREGRLTYLGASHAVDFGEDNVLLDLGGGSLEIVRGHGEEVQDVISLPLGGIRMQDRFLRRDPTSKSEYRALVAYLHGALEPYQARFGVSEATQVFLSSGTAQDLALALAAGRGLTPSSTNGLRISVEDLGELIGQLRRMNEEERAQIPAFAKRARIIVAAATVLHTALTVLGASSAVISEGALREGMLAEELQRHEQYVSGLSARHRSALALAERFRVDLPHARQVTALSRELYTQLCEQGEALPSHGRGLLRAAATLHEAGQLIAQSSHHKHSAYLIRHGGLLGFGPDEVELVAQIARYHRRSLPKDSHPEFVVLSGADQRLVSQMAAILRVADGLDRSYGGHTRLEALERSGKGWQLTACVPNTLDRQGAQEKADLWEREFGPLSFVWLTEEDCLNEEEMALPLDGAQINSPTA
ncbi:Ppx/GppA phosphatase family protein [Deinococcus radiophilus]|uniref:Ppx/GppA family phosphatase n=1 Tax=Deinococcus radiophilus TaxID=32062 RepID=A0A3S0L5X1_9DEIO|nr:Ppx/GppA phosphatase family protein [Deinococcus radiophilus]RTR27770.1 Ppx/GppA family phosphatase [Deinococcus radiophilus]UFA50089.1 Ppx/GppA family phosphatase [Deinococcus radiophilus]